MESRAIDKYFAFSPFFPAPWIPGIPIAFFVLPLANAIGGFVEQAISAMFGFAMIASFFLCLVPSRIVIGPDGIEHRWLFWRRFFALRDVVGIERTFLLPARLVMRDGRKAFLTYTFSPRNDTMGERSPALLAIDAAIASAPKARADEPADAADIVHRASEGPAAWRARIAGNGGYRSDAVSSDALVRIVDDPTQREEVRGAAAVLLAPEADRETRVRIAEIAATTASSRLRVLLERTASGAPDDEVARGFEALARRSRVTR